MAFKLLATVAVGATTDTTVYTVPANTSAVLSTISVCNRSAVAVTYRLALVKSGEVLGDANYLAYEATLPAYSSDYHRGGFTLAVGEYVVARCSAAALSVVICGDES